jgi:hypothetical protein
MRPNPAEKLGLGEDEFCCCVLHVGWVAVFSENGVNGMNDIEGKAAREAVSERGQRTNVNTEVGLLQSGGAEGIDDSSWGSSSSTSSIGS